MKMKKIIFYINTLLILIVMGISIGSCADDLGNYKYNDIPEIQIEGIGESVVALAYQKLSISVDLKGKLDNDEDRYAYEWKAIRLFEAESADDPQAIVIGDTQNLDEVIELAPGQYRLIYTVTDKYLEVFFQHEASFTVITTTYEGWVVLGSEDGKVRLDMVSNVFDEKVHTKDILEHSDMPFKKGPKALIALNPEDKDDGSGMAMVDPNSPFYLITEEGTTRLHKTAFNWKEEYLLKYEMGSAKDEVATDIAVAGAWRMLATDKGIHTSDFSMGPNGLFGSEGNYVREDNGEKRTIKVAPTVGANIINGMQFVPLFMVYDMDNKRFAYYPTDAYLELTGQQLHEGCIPMNDFEADGDAFEFPVGYNFVYMENSAKVWSYSMFGLPNSVTYTILEDEGVYHLYGIGLDDYYMALMGMSPYTKTSYADLSNCTDITQAKHFAFSPLNNQMFYAVGNKVYRVDFDRKKPSADFQFEVPGEVTRLKFNIYRKDENALKTNELIVGLDKGVVDGGEIRIYDATDNLAQITQHKEMHSGFARVVDVIYKEPIN